MKIPLTFLFQHRMRSFTKSFRLLLRLSARTGLRQICGASVVALCRVQGVMVGVLGLVVAGEWTSCGTERGDVGTGTELDADGHRDDVFSHNVCSQYWG